jgi:hypothetical protein
MKFMHECITPLNAKASIAEVTVTVVVLIVERFIEAIREPHAVGVT